MKETSPLWRQIAPSEFPWEREALDFVRQGLPDHEPYRAWANFEFLAEDGGIHEVDLLVLSPKGLFLVEIKSWSGTLEGDAATWVVHQDGRIHTYDNPLLLANRKARKLASLLKRQKAGRSIRMPFVEPLVFLSSPGLQLKLTGTVRQGVHLRDHEAQGSLPGAVPARPGILAALSRFDPEELLQAGKVRLDRPVAKAVARALEEAGIRPTQRAKHAGDYVLDALLDSGPDYQDWQAHHVSSERICRRIRIYTVATAAGAEARARLERAARREIDALEPVSHPGLLKPQHLTHHHLGPALVFEHDPKAIRLDHFLKRESARLGFADRLALLRQVAETVQYVHEKRLYHRALSPQSILVFDPDGPAPRLRILNWQTAAHEALTTQRGPSGTSHLEQLVEDSAQVYVAPEAFTLRDASPEALDVFSLGALAWFLFSGRHPAPSVLEMHDLLRAGKGLRLESVVDGADPDLSTLIQLATHPLVDERWPSVTDFLAELEKIETKRARSAEEPVSDPLEALTGDRFREGFLVKRRLGKGSTSVVFLVEEEGQEKVLKLAVDAEADERLRAEAEVLRRLKHPRLVQIQRTVTVGDRFGLLLARAGDETVAQRLRNEGRFQVELLQRFGEDLLQAVAYLEREGIPHRDIKPDNLGIARVGRNKELHLVLFDFSLSSARTDQIFAGTRPYLDPFLPERKPRRWDLQAERFAAGVTLYEMATGALPRWGSGKSHPGMTEEEVRVESDLLDAAVRAPLARFFQQALRRDPRRRFDNSGEMLAAWRAAFEEADRRLTTTFTEEQPDELAAACAQAALETSVSLLCLSTRAANALERAAAVTVRDLLRLPTSEIHRMRGVGSKTRKELLKAIELLTARLGRPEPALAPPPSVRGAAELEPMVISLDLLVRQIFPKKAAGELRILEALFGFLPGAPDRPSIWPSQSEVASALGLTRARVSQVLVRARERWQRNPSLTLLRDDVAKMIQGQGGVTTVEELFAALLATRGSAQEEKLRIPYAAAALRAATEVEESRATPRWLTRRTRGRVLLSLSESDGETLLDSMETLGRKADELAAMDPLPSPQRALEVLQELSRRQAASILPPERLLRLATAASRNAALSSRLEIYPRDLSADRALRLASGSLLGAQELSVEDIRDRVLSRFPEAPRLPGRPQLDDLLTAAGLGLRWDPSALNGRGAYNLPPATFGLTLSSSTTFQRSRTTPAPPPVAELAPELVDARLFEERLQRAAQDGAFLALVVRSELLLRAEEELSRRFPVERISLEERWLEALRHLARRYEVKWSFVLEADALAEDDPDAVNLRKFAAEALKEVEGALSTSPRTVLLSRLGLLARYRQMDLVERLRDRVSRRPGPGEAGLHGLWLLLPADGSVPGPDIDGEAVPVVTRAQWTRVPEAWLRNEHRAGLEEAAPRKETA